MKMMGFPWALYTRLWGTPYVHDDHLPPVYLLTNSEPTYLILRKTCRLHPDPPPTFEGAGHGKVGWFLEITRNPRTIRVWAHHLLGSGHFTCGPLPAHDETTLRYNWPVAPMQGSFAF